MGLNAIKGLRGEDQAFCTCDDCGSEVTIPARHGDKGAFVGSGKRTSGHRNLTLHSEASVIAALGKIGWSNVKNRLRCPKCTDARKSVKQEIKTMAVAETELRQPTREQKRQIMAMLDASYDTKAGRYTGGETDKTVAEAIGGGVMPGWVSDIREEFFGPDGGNDDMEAVMADLNSARAALTDLTKANAEAMDVIRRIETDMRQQKERIDRAISRVEAIKLAVGPKAARA